MAALSRPGLLVARDLEISSWLDRLVGASVAQIRSRFSLGRTQAYRRLQVLQAFGLVRRRHLTATRPPLYTVASRSLRVASCEHTLALTELIVEAARRPIRNRRRGTQEPTSWPPDLSLGSSRARPFAGLRIPR